VDGNALCDCADNAHEAEGSEEVDGEFTDGFEPPAYSCDVVSPLSWLSAGSSDRPMRR
jgi:hypothetical protein